MDSAQIGEAWAREAQALAERGVIECRMCKRREDLEGAFQLWRSGVIVYALCDGCARSHDVLMTPTERGIEIRARRRSPYLVTGREGAP